MARGSLCARALQRQLGIFRADIFNLDGCFGSMVIQPDEILFGICGVDANQKNVLFQTIKDHVVDDAAALIEQQLYCA